MGSSLSRLLRQQARNLLPGFGGGGDGIARLLLQQRVRGLLSREVFAERRELRGERVRLLRQRRLVRARRRERLGGLFAALRAVPYKAMISGWSS